MHSVFDLGPIPSLIYIILAVGLPAAVLTIILIGGSKHE